METTPSEYTGMLNAVKHCLCILSGHIPFSLNFYQEPVEMITAHDVILRVLLEQAFDVRRGFRLLDLEPPPETEAHSES